MTSEGREPFLTRLINAVGRRVSDRRLRFYELSKLPPERREPRSDVICFFSSVDNIGNYTPNLAMHQMLGMEFDYWCMHTKPVDFDFVNKNYKAVVLGGAGLLHGVFEPFWRDFGANCALPAVVWGVGACVPDGKQQPVSPEAWRAVEERVGLVNVRDDVTLEVVGAQKPAVITPCPTIVWVGSNFKKVESGGHLLIAEHDGLADADTLRSIRKACGSVDEVVRRTNNIQEWHKDGAGFIREDYAAARAVVTTRLHGAIFAYSLGIPFLTVARDRKIDDFVRLYGNGIIHREPPTASEIKTLLEYTPDRDIAFGDCLDFGESVASWLNSHGVDCDPTGIDRMRAQLLGHAG